MHTMYERYRTRVFFQEGGGGKQRGSVRASHPPASGLNLGAPDFLTVEILSAALKKLCLEKNQNPKNLFLREVAKL